MLFIRIPTNADVDIFPLSFPVPPLETQKRRNMLLYSIHWKKLSVKENILTLRITFIDRTGRVVRLQKKYDEWIGVCTDSISRYIAQMTRLFPGIRLSHEKLDDRSYRMILPYFRDRLKTAGNLESPSRSFYKIYVKDSHGRIDDACSFFRDRYEVAYYGRSDWLVRIYIDLCSRNLRRSDATGFYYRWYEVNPDDPRLITSLEMSIAGMLDMPKWTVASFDIETVPAAAAETTDRVPDGSDPGDRIVMISIVKWRYGGGDGRGDGTSVPAAADDDCRKWVLFLNPTKRKLDFVNEEDPATEYVQYSSEKCLLNDFHCHLEDCHVLTGYNIDSFDIPCIFARLLWLGMGNVLQLYSSEKIGDHLVTTFQDKIVIDMYHYFRIFSDYDLASLKLDDVAKKKLGGDGKMAVDSVGIGAWYGGGGPGGDVVTPELCLSDDPEFCRGVLRPKASVKNFGTFFQYVEYCLRDSELVRDLFRKEEALGFLTARANLVALDVAHAMHLGKPRFVLEVFKTRGTVLGFFFNADHFQNRMDGSKFSSVFVKRPGGKKTFQGGLNFCLNGRYFEDVVVMDFASMYPSTIRSSNLCYGTCDILTAEEYASIAPALRDRLTKIPYRVSTEKDFATVEERRRMRGRSDDDRDLPPAVAAATTDTATATTTITTTPAPAVATFSYPAFDPEVDEFVIVVNEETEGFLPRVIEHFLKERERHQRLWRATRNVFHYNSQLCIKLLVNSLYGTMACRESPLSNVVLAMAITCLARYQLLGAFHYVQDSLDKTVCYVDTDSLMVHAWKSEDCDDVNRFLNLSHVELKFEQRMSRLLLLLKKKYVYETGVDGRLTLKGFQRRANGLVRFMCDAFVGRVMGLRGRFARNLDPVRDPGEIRDLKGHGWKLWVDTLLEARFMCRDPRRYAVTRKAKKLNQYKSTTCAAVKILKKFPEKEGGYIDYTYGRADVSREMPASDRIASVEDCKYVDFEQLFAGEKKTFYTLLNIGYWHYAKPYYPCQMVFNTMRWKDFAIAEMKSKFPPDEYHSTPTSHPPSSKGSVVEYIGKQKNIMMLVEKGVEYTFELNDCSEEKNERKDVVFFSDGGERRKSTQPARLAKCLEEL